MGMRFVIPLLVSLGFFVNRASACAVCSYAANKENQIAYLVTTGFLTFLPLLFAGGLMLWIRRRAQQATEDASSRSAQVVPLEADRVSDAQA